jgi:NAD(P)-dependent dehydrogenase (short-subunit alcohol dehydrogenase family)
MMSTWPNVQFDYTDAHVLVTGGSNGIGAGIAAAYRAAGAHVTITGTRASAADYDDDLSGYRYLQLQLTDNQQIEAVAAALPQLDILINNAGGNFMRDNEYDPDVFERALRVNLISAYRLAHACHDKLARSLMPGGASVIGLGSMTSLFGVEVVPGYGAAKGGLAQLTKTLAIAWARDNIRVNTIAAGIIASKMTAPALSEAEFTEPVLARTPLKRIGTPQDIAGAILFLTSAAAGFITGQLVPVDGGYSIMG